MIKLLFTLFLLFPDMAFGIRGGQVAAANEAPFAVFIGNCSASLVGPKVLLTSAGCKRSGQAVSFTFQGISHSGKCEAHPQSRSRHIDFDISLCKFEPAIEAEELLARLDDITAIQGEDAFLIGFGSSNDSLGVKRFANVKVDEIRTGSIAVSGDGVISAGDTGAPVIRKEDLVSGPFRVLGVSVAVISGTNDTVSVRTDKALDFFRDFAAKNKVDICGINSDCIGNQDLCGPEREIVDFFEGELRSAKDLLKQCLEENRGR